MAWSSALTVTPPADEPVTLAVAKEFIGEDAEAAAVDALIEGFIAAAREQIEAVTGTRLVEQTVELQADSFADLDRLPIGPVSAISAISYRDAAGVEQLLADTAYEMTGAGLERSVRAVFGHSWPAAAQRAASVRVRMTVGYADLPKPLWLAILLMVGDMYAHRESVAIGAAVNMIAIPTRIESLLANYRIWL